MLLSDSSVVEDCQKYCNKYTNRTDELFKKVDSVLLSKKSAIADELGVQSLRLVNSTHILTVTVLVRRRENIIKKLAEFLPVSCLSPKMSKIFFRVNGFTVSIGLKFTFPAILNGESNYIQVLAINLAGCCVMENVLHLGSDIGHLLQQASEGSRVLNIGYQLVNNVIIMNVGGNEVINIEELIKKSKDNIVSYNPKRFPGAIFEASEDINDCQVYIAFSTGFFSFLGVIKPHMFEKTLRERLLLINECKTGEKNDADPKARHRKRIANNMEDSVIYPDNKTPKLE